MSQDFPSGTQGSELELRLLARGTGPTGVIDVGQPQERYERAHSWVRQHGALLEHVLARHGAGTEPEESSTPLLARLPARVPSRQTLEPSPFLNGSVPTSMGIPVPETTRTPAAWPHGSSPVPPVSTAHGPVAARDAASSLAAHSFTAPPIHAVRASAGAPSLASAGEAVRGGPLVVRRKPMDGVASVPRGREEAPTTPNRSDPDRAASPAELPRAGLPGAPPSALDLAPPRAMVEGAGATSSVAGEPASSMPSLGLASTPHGAATAMPLPLRSRTSGGAAPASPLPEPATRASRAISATAAPAPELVQRMPFSVRLPAPSSAPGAPVSPTRPAESAESLLVVAPPASPPAGADPAATVPSRALGQRAVDVPVRVPEMTLSVHRATSWAGPPRAAAVGPAPADIVWRKAAPGSPTNGIGTPASPTQSASLALAAPPAAAPPATHIARAPALGSEAVFPETPGGGARTSGRDVAQLVEHVTRTFLRQIEVERERRGMGRWL